MCSVTKSHLTLCNLVDCSPQVSSSVHGILQATILEWVALPSPRMIFLTQGSNPGLLHLLHWQAGSPLAPYPCHSGSRGGSDLSGWQRPVSDLCSYRRELSRPVVEAVKVFVFKDMILKFA